ncbi:pitrilysin family protein [Porphyromonas sp.]|uniref:M16 family metallopeptidase n=1 Tax=Porphyromonas sp. TaxID=1924944 RepID=UPI0026DCDBE9|nr:pitrilysin family protein [Porphyromonas sp.]MDO4695627.1 pitrilysin family protein [Porphyromonas sp.]MDO4770499.1 pitrilysin family protein [Porphyromonas sp.]
MSTTQFKRGYFSHTLPNGLRVALFPTKSKVIYCGVAIKVGSRQDPDGLHGLAHLAEHMIFKGTTCRKSWHILNRMESVGGELNAFTSKEETFVYTISPRSEVRRSIELLSDIVLNATFPEHELVKEKDVIADEINLYKDTPAEQIYDDFDAVLYPGHPLGNPILGDENSLGRMTQRTLLMHTHKYFRAENMVCFCMGQISEERFVKLCEAYFYEAPSGYSEVGGDIIPSPLTVSQIIAHDKPTHQTHTIIGNLGPTMFDKHRAESSLLMNYLGGSSMNSRLNLALREKRGWVYNVEGSLTSLTDTGWWQIYFGCDPSNAEKARKVVCAELDILIEAGLKDTALRAWVKQVKGQLALTTEQHESRFLNFGKQLLHFGFYRSIDEVSLSLDAISTTSLLNAATELFSTRHTLIYRGIQD